MKKMNKIFLISAAALTGVFMSSCCFLPQEEEKLDLSSMTLVWEESFDTGTLNTENWYYFEGNGRVENVETTVNESTHVISGPIHNNEVQDYRKSAVSIINDADDTEDGCALRITATSPNGSAWTSGKIQSSNKVDIKYGYIEARIRQPVAYDGAGNEIDNNGVWPAFWMMPTNSEYGVWPRSGEIDIMEYSPSTSGMSAYATLHHAVSKTDSNDIYPSLGKKIIRDNEYHTYGMMWTSGTLEAFYDGESLGIIYANPGYENWAAWPYDQDFYVIINLAMGGTLGANINPDMRKAVYDVDYVRYYK